VGAVSRRAIAEGTTVRELAPRLIEAGLRGAAHGSPAPATPAAPTPAAPPTPVPFPSTDNDESAAPAVDRPPVVVMSELYTCGVCNAELKLGAVSQHMNLHLKEHLAAQAARS
jgi:hypothetical protein